ncbi:MAG: hypothetical protein ACHQDE_07975, partial [Acidimicrobiia bacterium]
FLAGSVPVYWGDPLVERDFNRAAFINFAEHGTVARTVEAVLDAEGDTSLFARLRTEPPMSRAAWDASGNPERVVEFLERVLNWRSTARKTGEWRRRVVRTRAKRWVHAAGVRVRRLMP